MNEAFFMHRALHELSGAVPGDLLQADVQRIETSWFGMHNGPRRPGAVAVYAGGRSGIELMLARHRFPDVALHVVEHDSRHRALLQSLIPAATYHETFTALLDNLQGARIDFLRVDFSHYAEAAECLLRQPLAISVLTMEIPPQIDWYEPVASLRHVADDVFIRHLDDVFRFDTPRAPFDVSVIVPAYNVEVYLPQCLDSLTGQTLRRIEIIVMDDGSPDSCGAIADQYALDYPGRVRVIHQKNAGCAAARANGLLAAQGEFVGFVDGDDWVDVKMFAHLHRLVLKYGTDIAQCGYRLEYESGDSQPGSDIHAGHLDNGRSGVIWNPEEVMTVQPTIWRRIYRKSFLDAQKITFPPHIKRFDDLPFQFECLAKTNRLATTPEPYYAYRQGRIGQDIMARDTKLFVHFEIFDFLKPRVLDTAKIGTVARLLDVELNTHLWALGRIEPALYKEYRQRAIQSLANGYEMLGYRRRLQLAARKGRLAFGLALKSLMAGATPPSASPASQPPALMSSAAKK